MPAPQPRWHPAAETRAKELTVDYNDNLRRVAVRLARHDRLASVDARHVDKALNALHRSGIINRPWYRRTDWELGLGTFLAGVFFSIPTVVGAFVAEENQLAWNVSTMLATGAFSIGLVAHALAKKWHD